ncbi:TM2 domain-containing protein almondex isoform X2 [Folsomia candida]|nr:TM2 domain-containing protein almondex isoform X2 [Folsomia candida]
MNQQDSNCSEMYSQIECIQCDLDEKCRYGENITISCKVKNGVECKGSKEFKRHMICQYCYQTPMWQQICNSMKGCNSVGPPPNSFPANCTVSPEVICLGSRWFSRNMPCKWKNGYRWSTTFVLSVTLGGFGADRFYLGRWQEGIGKLFSFGGLGVWTIIDIILIGVRYLGPADGSLYVD